MNGHDRFCKQAEKLVKLMLREQGNDFYENYHRNTLKEIAYMLDQYATFKASEQKDFEPYIQLDKKLEKHCDKLIQQAKVVGMYHEIGFQIAEYFDDRLSKEYRCFAPLQESIEKGEEDWKYFPD